VIALALFASVAVIVWRLERTVRDLLPLWLASHTPATPLPPKSEPIPNDLDELALRESEPWAREQMRASLRDSYTEHGDWDAVRSRVLT
jgi:hypothetical protein